MVVKHGVDVKVYMKRLRVVRTYMVVTMKKARQRFAGTSVDGLNYRNHLADSG